MGTWIPMLENMCMLVSLFRYHILRHEYDALFHDDRILFDQYIEIVNKRMHDIVNDTYMNAGKIN
jgi:hypothetical protein